MSAATIQQDQLAPYRQPVHAVLAALGTDARLGLGQREAQARVERYGKNELVAEKPSRHGGNPSPDFTTCSSCRGSSRRWRWRALGSTTPPR